MSEKTQISNLLSAHSASIKLLTEQDVAILLRKSVYWLRRKRSQGGQGSIPYRKLGSSVRYAESDVLNYIEQHALQTSTRGGANDEC